jgi:methyl-accepting chemotaxis protein
MHAISGTIRELDRYSARIASAVEQQALAAREIAVSANSASQSVHQVNGAIAEMDKVAGQTSLAADRLTKAAGNIGQHTKKIRQQVKAFTDDIHAMQASA